MKETIEYNYNILIDSLNEDNSLYSFLYNNELYLFIFYSRGENELEDILECTREINKKGINTLQFILNKDGLLLTKVEETNYVLLKCMYDYNKNVDIIEIINNCQKFHLKDSSSVLYRNNWETLWSDKIDYFEYQVRELGKDKSVILDSFSYYVGLVNISIELVNHTNKLTKTNEDRITFSHRRIFYPNYKLNYYNPLSFIFDLEVRDVAEYIKYYFFAGEDAFLELSTYLKSVRLSKYSYQMLLARLIYPSYYFDLYDKIMNQNEDQDILVKIIAKVDDYEEFLKKAYLEISKYAQIEKIEWLNT